MSTEARLYETPARNNEEKEAGETNVTYKRMAESKYSYGMQPGQSEVKDPNDEALNDIEAKIKTIGDQLRELHGKMAVESDKYSETYLAFEEERK